MHSTHFIYGYMVSDIWLRTILIVRKETCCRHIGYSYRLTARVLLYAPSHGLCYTSCGALAGTRNSSMGPPHEGSIRRPITPWANARMNECLTTPQHEKQIGYWVSYKCKLKPNRHVTNMYCRITKEGNVLFNDALSTFCFDFLWSCCCN